MSRIKAMALLSILVLTACAPPKANFQTDPKTTKENTSVIQASDKAVQIVTADGKRTVDGFIKFMMHDGQWAGEVRLDPGEHTLGLMYQNTAGQYSKYIFKINTLAGHVYKIKGAVLDNDVYLGWKSEEEQT